MSLSARRFFDRTKSNVVKDSDLPNFFTFHLTIELGQPFVTVQSVRDCYLACDLAVPSWLAPHFSNGLKSKPRRFIKANGGYRLENRLREEIAKRLGHAQSVEQTSAALNRLEPLIEAGPKRDFLHETIKCFEAGANRAAVVMCWNLALHHLQDHLMHDADRLASFNAALAKNTDSRVKIKSVTKPDDYRNARKQVSAVLPRSQNLDFDYVQKAGNETGRTKRCRTSVWR